jgi:hypothetical protein
MKQFALVLVCIGLVIASVGSVSAQSTHTVHVPMVAVDARIITNNPEIDRLTRLGVYVYGSDPRTSVHVPVAVFSLECGDAVALVSSDNPINEATGTYGAPEGELSATNPGSNNPPIIAAMADGELTAIAWLTENPSLSPRLDTSDTLDYLRTRASCD